MRTKIILAMGLGWALGCGSDPALSTASSVSFDTGKAAVTTLSISTRSQSGLGTLIISCLDLTDQATGGGCQCGVADSVQISVPYSTYGWNCKCTSGGSVTAHVSCLKVSTEEL